MSSIVVRPSQLRNLAQHMRSMNTENIEAMINVLNIRDERNEALSAERTNRETTFYENMFIQVDRAGLETLLASFIDSYNRLSGNRAILNRATGHRMPTSMTDLFMADLPGVAREDARFSVGGQRWGGLLETSTLNSRYIAVVRAIEAVLTEAERQRDILRDFEKTGVTSRHYTTGSGSASRAFISRLNHVSNDAIRVLTGIDGRAGQRDAFVATVREVLSCLLRNLEIAMAKGEELAAQGEAIANDREAMDRLASTQLFGSEVGVRHHISQLVRSEVELAFHRPERLSDGKGLETIFSEQHEQRYNTLKSNLTTNIFEVADFIANPTTAGGRNLATLMETALEAIREWEQLIGGVVTAETRPSHAQASASLDLASNPFQTVSRPWTAAAMPHRSLGSYLTSGVVEDITSAKSALIDWQAGFETTMNRASNFVSALNNDVHLSGLSTRAETAIYPVATLSRLQSFATNMKNGLERQAKVYRDAAAVIRSSMSGRTLGAYANTLEVGANYFQAVAQSIEADFRQGVGQLAWEENNGATGSTFWSGTGTFLTDTAEKFRDTVVGSGAGVARSASQRGVHFGRSVAGRLQPRNASGNRWVTDTSAFNSRVTRTFRNLSPTVSNRVGQGLRVANVGFTVWGAVSYFRSHYNKYGNVGRATSFTGYMLGTSFVTKGKNVSKVGQAITNVGRAGKFGKASKTISSVGKGMTGAGKLMSVPVKKLGSFAGKGLAKVGLGVIGVKAAPLLVGAAVAVGIGMGAKWLYNNVPVVNNVVNAIGDGINAVGNAIGNAASTVGNAISNVGQALNPFNWGRS